MGVKNRIRIIQRKLKNKFIKRAARGIKLCYFISLEFFGAFLFWLGRIVRVIPPICPYSKDRVKKILLVRTDRIGDVILSLPTVRALRENFPQSFIGFLTTSYTKDLVTENKDINAVITYEREAPIYQKINFVKKLKGYKFDLAIILSPYFESAFFGYLSGAPFRIGYPLNGSGFLLTTKVDAKSHNKHEIESCLDIVRTIGIDTDDKRPKLSLSRQAQSYAEDFFVKHKILPSELKICIHPGGYEEYTRWMTAGYAQVADALISRYQAKVILLGAKTDRVVIDEIKKLMSQQAIVSDWDVSLPRLAAVIERCAVFLGNNSGPMHIASAVGTPVVAIFGPIHPLDSENKWAPGADEHIIVRKKMDCSDCHPGHCRDYKCMQMVTAEDVLSAMEIQILKWQNRQT